MGRWFEPSKRSHISIKYQRVALVQPFFIGYYFYLGNILGNNSFLFSGSKDSRAYSWPETPPPPTMRKVAYSDYPPYIPDREKGPGVKKQPLYTHPLFKGIAQDIVDRETRRWQQLMIGV